MTFVYAVFETKIQALGVQYEEKMLVLGSTAGISGLMMEVTGISVMASTSGYDAYKDALKNTNTVQNVAVQAAAALQDNGATGYCRRAS